jgi:hypothetical protein
MYCTVCMDISCHIALLALVQINTSSRGANYCLGYAIFVRLNRHRRTVATFHALEYLAILNRSLIMLIGL